MIELGSERGESAGNAARVATSRGSGGMGDAAEFEVLCARELRDCGWSVHPAEGWAAPGDGFLARRAGVSLLVRCHFAPAEPVPVHAILLASQQRLDIGASHVAVVAQEGFASAARLVALSARVLLLEREDLRQVWNRISRVDLG